ncbi:MAG: cysteine--tRNA ligase [Bradymonadaceae bacterium]
MDEPANEVAPRPVEIYDTRTGQTPTLEPIEPGKVKMYVCGVTVYDLTHIGHARVYVFFDVVQRFFRYLGYDVTHVRNHTDVDDKIIDRAQEEGEDPLELAEHYIDEFKSDMDRLRVEDPDYEPRVSECVDDVIRMVETLEEKGYAYEVDGDVFYRVEEFDDYGKLSKRDLDEMEAGRSGRTDEEIEQKKEHPFDFTLWKSSEPGEPSWESPWGEGRPGWHIECSVMSTKYLGPRFDIHGGGSDLIFPHHENEIAQSEAASGANPLANYWMHMGMVNVAEENEEGEIVEEKMSKSLGNFWTTRDVLDQFHPDAIRYFLLSTHYRKPITYSVERLEEATDRVEYLYATRERIEETLDHAGYSDPSDIDGKGELVSGTEEVVNGFLPKFEEALADDFNTSKALATIDELAKLGNELAESPEPVDDDRAYTLFLVENHLAKAAGDVLGFLEQTPADALREIREIQLADLDITVEQIEEKIAARKEARENEAYQVADEIRDELADAGIEIMDKAWGTIWRVE